MDIENEICGFIESRGELGFALGAVLQYHWDHGVDLAYTLQDASCKVCEVAGCRVWENKGGVKGRKVGVVDWFVVGRECAISGEAGGLDGCGDCFDSFVKLGEGSLVVEPAVMAICFADALTIHTAGLAGSGYQQ